MIFLKKSRDRRGDRQDRVFIDLGPLWSNLKGGGVVRRICVCFLQSVEMKNEVILKYNSRAEPNRTEPNQPNRTEPNRTTLKGVVLVYFSVRFGWFQLARPTSEILIFQLEKHAFPKPRYQTINIFEGAVAFLKMLISLCLYF